MNRLESSLKFNRYQGKRSLGVFLNAGDPSLEISQYLIHKLQDLGVDFIELGVPFANSFTDGKTILRSHERALNQNVEFEDCLTMLEKVRRSCDIPIVLLLDFSHSVKRRGVEDIVGKSAEAGADAILLHGLPPLFQKPFIDATHKHDIGRIFSLYPNSSEQKIQETVGNSRGFIYLVSQYGRTGSTIDFRSDVLQSFYERVRKSTSLPLMAGFGIKTCDDMGAIFDNSDTDGVILGSVLSQIIEDSLSNPDAIPEALGEELRPLIAATHVPFKTLNLESNREYFAQAY